MARPKEWDPERDHKAHAKLNLHLKVLAREQNGFHQIETVMVRVGLSDLLRIRPAEPGIHLEVDGDVGGIEPRDNLVTRAARSFFEAANLSPAVHIELVKRIPPGAGLAGGSADAAVTLNVLNRMHAEPLTNGYLMALGAELGSDLPFMMSGLSPALAWGRGERLMALPRSKGMPRHVLLALPGIHLDTGWAYRSLSSRSQFGPQPTLLPLGSPGASAGGGREEWHAFLSHALNDFLPVAHGAHPSLAGLYEHLLAQTPLMAGMTGTGSAHFALFESSPQLEHAASAMRRLQPDVTFHTTSIL